MKKLIIVIIGALLLPLIAFANTETIDGIEVNSLPIPKVGKKKKKLKRGVYQVTTPSSECVVIIKKRRARVSCVPVCSCSPTEVVEYEYNSCDDDSSSD